MKNNPEKYDAVIIGGGPGGYTAAIRLSQLGGRACLVEKGILGGSCVNVGCIPTKFLTSAAKLMQDIKNAGKFGITAKEISHDAEKMKAEMRSLVRKLSTGVERLLENNGVDVVKGNASLLEEGAVTIHEDEKKTKLQNTVFAENIIIATGSKPARPSSFPRDKDILTSDEIFEFESIPKSIAIIGGGYIGLEFASIFSSLGCAVTVIEKLERILSAEENEVSSEIARLMERSGVDIFTSSIAGNIKRKSSILSLDVKSGENDRVLEVEKILLTLGREPFFDRGELGNLGVSFDEKGIKTDSRTRTSKKGIYAIGDVNGKSAFAHVAMKEGVVAAENIMGRKSEIDYGKVPSCTFTIPEIASIGKKEGTAGKFPFIANGKAHTMNETDGFVKVYIKDKKLVGASIIGPHASDLIAIAGELLGKNAGDIKKRIVAHPTLPEALFEAVSAALGEAINIRKR